MKTIWKFPLDITSTQAICTPAGSTFLDVQVQNDKVCLWAEVDTEKEDTAVSYTHLTLPTIRLV